MVSRNRPDPFKDVTHAVNVLIVATMLLYLCLSVVFTVGYLHARTANVAIKRSSARAESARLGLCILRDHLSDEVAGSVAFLKLHPLGIPGVDAVVIRNNIENQRQTLHALSVVRCE